eukprot:CAMPEP_0117419990 /NCGR_PEP_ID=MMETSP0758-20121206/1437_1 /TAXON_ID=63605 /ORGANISM="Percolomonas cosmopolitus, Strain AE-1 (ATCC 50343)" /LENGTH=268 /DNA_ID=CAMNT_0005201377 /DNA_START=382 /DNA_END=1185 /DNA_ORIENTATION=-
MLYFHRNKNLDEAFINHLEDPMYWTPQRLTTAYSFSDKNIIIGELLVREYYIYHQTKRGQPIDPLWTEHLEKYDTTQFNYGKINRLFKEYKQRMKIQKGYTRVPLPAYFRTRANSNKLGILTEGESLENLINKSRRLVAYGDHDDELPMNVKIPFSEHSVTAKNRAAELALKNQSKFVPFNQYDFHRPEVPIEEISTISQNNLKPRQRVIITEIGRHVKNGERRIYAREQSGMVRTASQNELELIQNVGSLKKTRSSFGGSNGGRRQR